MTHVGLSHRLARLEGTAGGGVPLYVRHWLGEALTPEQVVAATAEWDTVRTILPTDLATFPPDARDWLATRSAA